MAKFSVGQIAWLSGDAPALELELVVVIEVVAEDPAQYIVARTKDSSKFTCGEGIGEPGALSAL